MTLRWTAQDSVADRAHRVAATLPDWYSPAASPELTVLDGSTEWFSHDFSDILVFDPVFTKTTDASLTGRITLAEPFSGAPGLASLPAFAADSILVTAFEHGDDLNTAILHAVRLLRVTGVTDLRFDHLRTTAGSALADGTGLIGGRRVPLGLTVALTTARPATHTLQFFTTDTVAALTVPDGSDARPVLATVTRPDGATTLPTHYESADRYAWRRAHQAYTQGVATPDVLSCFLADLRTVASLIGAPGDIDSQ
ncbi:hypothetical protein [Actinoplanes sp. NBRC 101535]|uniref:hypothetical protein n=1 Tax=Actinoplanes sp. NBRC 101535 TaxID=3032196 RepID=UPI00249FCA3E|nr:hypothetical protein [Actinoplanes sp. NBRC 101535]GLY02761.1 hypothetical protein Acsp01_31400 [Actinoplanes sp. NBRC 101535]